MANQLPSNNSSVDTFDQLSTEDTREILTPFAFKLDESLFGLSLASPWKRAFASSTDFLLIAILSSAGGEFLAIFLALAFYRMGSKKYVKIAAEAEPNEKLAKATKVKGRKRRAFYRLVGSFIVFVVLVDVLPPLINPLMDDDYAYQRNVDDSESGVVIKPTDISLEDGVKLAVLTAATYKKASKNSCKTLLCWQDVLAEVPDELALIKIPQKEVVKLVADITSETNLEAGEQEKLNAWLIKRYMESTEKENTNSESLPKAVGNVKPPSVPDDNYDPIAAAQNKVSKTQTIESQAKKDQSSSKPVYSLTELIQGIIEKDLGLGFGWAAFYFTVFTAWWQGQTPGKRLFKIKVLQLDGTPLSLWDSFGRYGGYAAGLATGLLGFVQVFWNPNRQAIHDQISATVVIDLKQRTKRKI